MRHRGVPSHCLTNSKDGGTTSNTVASFSLNAERRRECPLVPGVYNALPRSWCHRWRKYIKSGEGSRPCAPETSACLCDAHRLPLIPPHLEAFLYCETSSLLSITNYSSLGASNVGILDDGRTNDGGRRLASPRPLPVGMYPVDEQLGRGRSAPNTSTMGRIDSSAIAALRASGANEVDIQMQRMAMLEFEELHQQRIQEQRERHAAIATIEGSMTPEERRTLINAQLDRENKVVVEILTDEEFNALEKWWPEIHSSYALKFAIVKAEGFNSKKEVVWTTPPCRECEPSGSANHDFVLRNRARYKGKNNTTKRK